MVGTWSWPYGLSSFVDPTSKGLDHPYFHVYACLLLCFMLVLAFLVQGFATLDSLRGFVVVWLHSTPMRPCLDVTSWDASPWYWLLCAYLSPFPLKFGQDSCHTSKGRPTFLNKEREREREREHPKLHVNHQPHNHLRGNFNRPPCVQERHHDGWSDKGLTILHSGLGVDRLATPGDRWEFSL